MLNPIHTRDTSLPEWPFESMDDVDEFVTHVAEAVEDAIDAEPEITVSATYPDRAFPMMTRDEFRAAHADLPFEDLASLTVQAHDRENRDFSVTLALTDDQRTGRLAVRGTSVTRVDGVDVQVKRALSHAAAKVRATREAEAQRRRDELAVQVERVTPSVPLGVPLGVVAGALVRAAKRKPRSTLTPRVPAHTRRWRRALNHQWTVAIVGGIVASIVGGIVLAVALSS